MSNQPPVLAYGAPPKPGSVIINDLVDGAVEIRVLPRPWWFFALRSLFLVVPLTALFAYLFITHPPNLPPGFVGGFPVLVIMFAPLMVAVLAGGMIVRAYAVQEIYIHADRSALRVFFTEAGDPVRWELQREDIRDVQVVRVRVGEKGIFLVIHLQQGERRIPIRTRTMEEAQQITAATRRGLGLTVE